LLVLLDQVPNAVDFLPLETVAPLQANWIEPELRFAVVPLDVDVRRFAAVACVEEDPIRSATEYGRHVAMLLNELGGEKQVSPVHRLLF
jgi:hypothetical protein